MPSVNSSIWHAQEPPETLLNRSHVFAIRAAKMQSGDGGGVIYIGSKPPGDLDDVDLGTTLSATVLGNVAKTGSF